VVVLVGIKEIGGKDLKRKQDLKNLTVIKRWYFSKTKKWKRYKKVAKDAVKKRM